MKHYKCRGVGIVVLGVGISREYGTPGGSAAEDASAAARGTRPTVTEKQYTGVAGRITRTM